MHTKGGRAQQAGRILAINALVFAVLCLLVEGGVRLTHPEIRPGGTTAQALVADSLYGATPGIAPNAQGLSSSAVFTSDARSVWRYAHARPGQPAWLFLGDSVTMGMGVPPDSTFAGLLAAMQDSLDLVNPSLVSYSSADYARVLEAWLERDAPSIERVTVVWCLNDVYADLPLSTAPAGARAVPSGLRRFLLEHVRTYPWLRATLFDRPQAYYQHDRRFYVADSLRPYLKASLGYLDTMHQQVTARGLPFEVVLLPYAAQLRTGDRLPQDVMARELTARGISVRDLWTAFYPAEDPAALYLYGDGLHLSENGHRRVAEAL